MAFLKFFKPVEKKEKDNPDESDPEKLLSQLIPSSTIVAANKE